MSIVYAKDLPFFRPWATRIGELILDFAALEFESCLWLTQMSGNPEQIQRFTKLRYASRVKEITEFAKTLAFSEQWKVAALSRWNNSLELATLRNRIAHNPLSFERANGAEEGEPYFIEIGIPDKRSGKQPRRTEGRLLSKADIEEAVNRIASLVAHLESLRKDWCTLRDKSKGDDNP